MTVNVKAMKEAMWDLNLSTFQLAASAGVPQAVVSDVLCGVRRCTCTTAAKLCEALGLDVDEVVTEES